MLPHQRHDESPHAVGCPGATPLSIAFVKLTSPQGHPRASLGQVSPVGPATPVRSGLRFGLPAPGSDTENSQENTHAQEYSEHGDEQQGTEQELPIVLGHAVDQRYEEHQQAETVQDSQDNAEYEQRTGPESAP